MRRMGYRIEFSRDEEYLIANTDVKHWEDLMMGESISPSLRLRNTPYVDGHNGCMGELKHFISLGDIETGADDATREEYLYKALCGEHESWKPIGISIDDVGALVVFTDGVHYDWLHLFPVADECVKLSIEADNSGGEVEIYHLYMDKVDDESLILLTEYWPWGNREMYFKSRYAPKHPDESFFYVEVVDHRK